MKIIGTFKQHDFESLFLQAPIAVPEIGWLKRPRSLAKLFEPSNWWTVLYFAQDFSKFPCKRVLTIKPPTDIYKEENRSKLYPNFYPKFQSNFSYFCHHFGYPPINPKNSYIFHCVPFLQQVSRTFVSCTYEIDEKIGLPSALCLGILTTRKNHLLQEKLYYNNYITTRKSYTKTRKSIYFKWMKLWTFYEHEHLCNGNLIY